MEKVGGKRMGMVGERVGQWDGECWCGRMEIVGAGVGRRGVNIGAAGWKTAWRAEGMRAVRRMVRRMVCAQARDGATVTKKTGIFMDRRAQIVYCKTKKFLIK